MKTQLRVQIGSLVHAQIPRTFSQDGLAHQVGYQHLDLAMRLVNQAISPKDLHAYDYLNILIVISAEHLKHKFFRKYGKPCTTMQAGVLREMLILLNGEIY